MGKKKTMEPSAYKSGEEYSQLYTFAVGSELNKAMEQHQQHHYPESPLDGKTVPYSIMDAKHKGRR